MVLWLAHDKQETLSLIGLLRGDEDYLIGLITGTVLLAVAIGMLKRAKRVRLAEDERLLRIRVNSTAGDIESLDENREVYHEEDTWPPTGIP